MSTARVNEEWVSGFTADTPVLMSNGKVKPISEISEGEQVVSFDPKTGAYTNAKVTNTWSDMFSDVLELSVGSKKIIVAASQLFYTPDKEFKTAPDAMQVMTDDGFASDFTVRKFKGGKVKLYDITVDKTHAFIANGIMVHNKGSNKKKSKPPAPPPDPVVTAGRVGQPLTVGVNGNTITVNPPPGAAASISVSYNGGVTAGYHSVPGTYYGGYNVSPPINVVNPIPAGVINSLIAAESQRSATCAKLDVIAKKPSQTIRDQYAAELESVRRSVEDARAADPYKNLSTKEKGAVSRDAQYRRIIDDVQDLAKFIKKERKLNNKEMKFLDKQCADIQQGIEKVRQQLSSGGGATLPDPGYPGSPVVCPPRPPNVSSSRIYSDSPDYAYFNNVGSSDVGCEAYAKNIPGAVRPAVCYTGPGAVACYGRNELFYKHYDVNNGKFYLDQSTENCV